MGHGEEMDINVMITEMSIETGPIIAFDPGGELTGMCCMVNGEVTSVGMLHPEDLKEWLMSHVQAEYGMVLTVICERFILYPVVAARMGFNELIPAKLEGYIEAVCNVMGHQYVVQTASDKEAYLPMAKKAYKHPGQHSKDAHAHILAYLMKKAKESNRYGIR